MNLKNSIVSLIFIRIYIYLFVRTISWIMIVPEPICVHGQEEKGPRNYSWRKDMESYEEKLEVLTAHKRVVHDSTRATRSSFTTNF